jgi:hypothetical protein
VAAQWSADDCEHRVEAARKTVRTDSPPIRAELAPLGEASEVHWVLDPNRHCDVLPVPGTERDGQTGVIRIDPANAQGLVSRYVGWETVGPDDVDWLSAGGLLSPYIPSGRTWQHSNQLDAQFVGEHPDEYAKYYVDVADGVVLVSSYADHFRNGGF